MKKIKTMLWIACVEIVAIMSIVGGGLILHIAPGYLGMAIAVITAFGRLLERGVRLREH